MSLIYHFLIENFDISDKNMYLIFVLLKVTKYIYIRGVTFNWNGTTRRKTAFGECHGRACSNIYLHSEDIKYVHFLLN